MMSIDHQQDHFKRSREQESTTNSNTNTHEDSTDSADSQLKRRKLNGSKDGIKKKKAEDEKVNKDNKEGKDGSEEFETKMYRSYIKSALEALDENSSSSSSTQIDTLTSQIGLPKTHPEAIKPANFVILLNALTNSISRLDSKRFDNLIIAIINYSKWYSVLTAPQVNVFKRFVITLCSYLPKWWGEISQVIIKQFTVATDKTKHHHELLKYFVQIIPTSIQSINKCLVRNFPNKNNGKAELVNYVGNLLNMMSYCTELRFNIWSLIIERTIQIDVELQNELDELDDDEDMDIDDDESDSDEDDDDDDTDSDGEVEGESGAVAGLKKRKVRFQNFESAIESEDEEDEDEDDLMEEEIDGHNLQSMAITDLSEKLDCILSLVFQNISAAMSNEIEEEQTVIQFNTLISLFKSHILPTYFTKSTQFILFYFTQLSPELTDSFLVTLIDVCFAQNETIDKRIKALQYLSSYLSRAKNLQKSQICFIFSYLTNWLNRYVEEREVEIDGNVNMDRFKLFYSTFQVLLYVFCFRHSMLKNQDTDEWELDIDKFFQRMIITKFNPLKYCNENVVMMFGKISQEENVAYCFSIIQKNKNEKLKGITGALSASDLKSSSSSSDSSASLQKLNLVKQQFVDLEGYFPFDPLFLKSSKRFIKDFYVEWTDIKNEYSSDSDSEDFDDLANDAIREVTRRNSMAVAHDEE